MKISDRHTLILLALVLVSFPARLYSQDTDREQVLAEDINRLGERALRDESSVKRSTLRCYVLSEIPCLKAPI